MQLWHGREGERLQLGLTGLKADFVVSLARDGTVEILWPEPDQGETICDAVEAAAQQKVNRRMNHNRLHNRRKK